MNTWHDFLGVAVLVGIVLEKRELGSDFRNRYGDYLRRIGFAIADEVGKDPDETEWLFTLPRETPLGEKSQPIFTELCEWLIGKDEEFKEYIELYEA